MKIKGKEVRLPKLFKKKWLAALRSGEYKQGTGYLFNGNGYCCIGVAGKICGIRNSSLLHVGLFNIGNDNVDFAEKYKVPKLLVGSDSKSNKDYNVIVDKLANMNDNDRSFKQIATYIERYL